MNSRLIAVLIAVGLVVVACNSDDVELSTGSTIITGATNVGATSSTTTMSGPDSASSNQESTASTLVGETVAEFSVVARFPNDNGVERHYVIPNGAYTDVDLRNFIIELIESDNELYGAEVFDSTEAAEAFLVDEADRTEEDNELLDRHWFVTLEGRDRIVFRGPFSDIPGGAIGS
ncbi:MAG TPA: hypothetical protein VE569_10975 [Acidimicrobiia bacterium]|jgi:hypothetical protein|nr:hypothetical protein [Acidimicrobiia bacterium]